MLRNNIFLMFFHPSFLNFKLGIVHITTGLSSRLNEMCVEVILSPEESSVSESNIRDKTNSMSLKTKYFLREEQKSSSSL